MQRRTFQHFFATSAQALGFDVHAPHEAPLSKGNKMLVHVQDTQSQIWKLPLRGGRRPKIWAYRRTNNEWVGKRIHPVEVLYQDNQIVLDMGDRCEGSVFVTYQ